MNVNREKLMIGLENAGADLTEALRKIDAAIYSLDSIPVPEGTLSVLVRQLQEKRDEFENLNHILAVFYSNVKRGM